MKFLYTYKYMLTHLQVIPKYLFSNFFVTICSLQGKLHFETLRVTSFAFL